MIIVPKRSRVAESGQCGVSRLHAKARRTESCVVLLIYHLDVVTTMTELVHHQETVFKMRLYRQNLIAGSEYLIGILGPENQSITCP